MPLLDSDSHIVTLRGEHEQNDDDDQVYFGLLIFFIFAAPMICLAETVNYWLAHWILIP